MKTKIDFKKINKLQYSISQGVNINIDKYQRFSPNNLNLSLDRSFHLAKCLYNKALKMNIYNIFKERENFPDMSFCAPGPRRRRK